MTEGFCRGKSSRRPTRITRWFIGPVSRSSATGDYSVRWCPITRGVEAVPGMGDRHGVSAVHRRGDTTDGGSSTESSQVEDLEQENQELKCSNEVLKRAASFFGAELDRQHEK